jgi:hypothetical protein
VAVVTGNVRGVGGVSDQVVVTSEAICERIVATLDAAIELRVAAHRERNADQLTVPEYLAALRAAREIEALLEPLRGSKHALARAVELVELESRDRDPEAVEPTRGTEA